MRIMLDSPATPLLPISMLLSPVVRLTPAFAPNAMLPLPVVLREREIADGRVVAAAGIVEKRALAKSVVATPIHVEKQRISAEGIVEPACRVVEQGECAASGVVLTGGVAQKRAAPTAVCLSAVLLSSTSAPIPVLNLAGPLLRRAYIPNAELYIPVTPARARSHRPCCLWGEEADLVCGVGRLLGFAVKAQSRQSP